MTFSKVQDLFAGGDEDAVGGFGDAVDRGVAVDCCAVGLGCGNGRRDGTVGAQGAGVRVVDGDVVGAEVVLGVAFGHFFAAEDFVVCAVGPGGFQEAAGCRARRRCRWRVRRSG